MTEIGVYLTLKDAIYEGIIGSLLVTPFLLGCYVILSTLLGHMPGSYEYFIVCATAISLVMLICLLTYAANRPSAKPKDLKVPEKE